MSDALKMAEALARTPKLLIIDDDYLIRLMFERLSKRYDIDVTSAATPQEGLEYLSQNQYDVVFLDVKFDNANGACGMDVLKQINAMDYDCHVVVMSGSVNMSNLMHEANKLGVLSFMHKPVSFTVDFLHKMLNRLHIRVVERKDPGFSGS